MQIRNPWGSFEWDGDWSDHSPLWTESMKAEVKPDLDDEDGTFWMSYADFLKHFVNVNVCHVNGYYEARVKGIFTRNEEEQVISKWFYYLTVPEACKLFIGVHQEDERIMGAKVKRSNLDLGIVVMKAGEDGKWSIYKVQDCELAREVEMQVHVEPGNYVIVPRTSGCTLGYDIATE